jgi:type IV pilus assembly protein PilM
MPLMPVADMRKLLKFNSKNYLQQDLPDYVFDCCYLFSQQSALDGKGGGKSMGSQKQKVVIGGIKKKLLNELIASVKSAGLIPDQVVPGLVGPINSFELAEPEAFAKEVVALVEIGFRNTTINILDAGDVILHRVIAFGGDKLTSGLSEALGISYPEAENIKVGMTSEIQDSLELLVNPLGRELRASIDFFEHQHDKPVAQIYLSGSTARNDVVMQALQAELMVPCKAWNPTQALEIDLTPEKAGELEQVAPQLSVAVGAAAAGF